MLHGCERRVAVRERAGIMSQKRTCRLLCRWRRQMGGARFYSNLKKCRFKNVKCHGTSNSLTFKPAVPLYHLPSPLSPLPSLLSLPPSPFPLLPSPFFSLLPSPFSLLPSPFSLLPSPIKPDFFFFLIYCLSMNIIISLSPPHRHHPSPGLYCVSIT